MAYASLVVLAQEVQHIEPHHQDYVHIFGKEQFECLQSDITFLLKLLEDFPGNSSLMVKQMESRITDVAYEVRDIIGLGVHEMKYRKTYKCCIDEVKCIVEDAVEIRKVLEMKKNNMLCHDFWTTSLSKVLAAGGNDTKVGLDSDLIRIKERVVGHRSALQIIPIVGMGGVGKTTLAKNVYDDPLSLVHFDFRAWVTVSQEYSTQKILNEILGIRKDNVTTQNVGSLIVEVHKKLSGRRFLIVIDDIWSVEAWDRIRNAFPDGNNGGRIIVTTRLTEVASNVGSPSSLHQMQLLGESQSWELFQKETTGEEHFPPQLESLGKIISKNCKGLPLTIVVIARLLKLNRKQEYWEKFADNINKSIMAETHDDQLMEILSLSYDNLPPHLKACFLYTSIFPEDYEIPSKKLIWTWVAEGFLKPAPDKSMEEVAGKCLADLVDRNLISVGKKRSNGRLKTCTVHDILRDLSLRKAKDDKFSQQLMIHKTDKMTTFTEKFLQKCIPWFKDETSSLPKQHFSSAVLVLRTLF